MMIVHKYVRCHMKQCSIVNMVRFYGDDTTIFNEALWVRKREGSSLPNFVTACRLVHRLENTPIHLSVCLSVTFSFQTKKRIAVFSRNFAGMCTMSWGCAV